MQEKARLLMEETGCEQGEAELALELADNDLEKAIKTIGSLLRHISAVKGKFYFQQKNLYGLVLVVVNTKTCEILRLRTVVSYNPTLFENSPAMDWYTFEKLIFSFRLDRGSLPDYTQEVEHKLRPYLLAQSEVLVRCDPHGIEALFRDFFSPDTAEMALTIEQLNLTQFRQLPDDDALSSAKVTLKDADPGTVRLQIQLVEDKSGREVNRLQEGDVVLSRITDTRDIAHYLAHLIGGVREGNMIPLPAVIRKVSVNAEGTEIQVYYAPGIIGLAHTTSDSKVRIVEMKAQPWWKKIIPWS